MKLLMPANIKLIIVDYKVSLGLETSMYHITLSTGMEVLLTSDQLIDNVRKAQEYLNEKTITGTEEEFMKQLGNNEEDCTYLFIKKRRNEK